MENNTIILNSRINEGKDAAYPVLYGEYYIDDLDLKPRTKGDYKRINSKEFNIIEFQLGFRHTLKSLFTLSPIKVTLLSKRNMEK
jgi:hypothetical protein